MAASNASSAAIAKRLSKETYLSSPEFAEVLAEYFADSHTSEEDTDEEEKGETGKRECLETVELEEDPGSGNDSGTEDEENLPVINTDIDCKAEVKPCDFAENAGKMDKKCQLSFTCSCKFDAGQQCSLLFTPVELVDVRANHQSLSRDELDLIILSQIQSGIHDGKETQRPKQKKQSERKKVRVDYYYKGFKICRDTFMYIHGIFKDRLTNLIAHYRDHGVVTRVHGNKNCMPHNALTYEQRLHVVRFISNFAEQHAILLPGRVPGYARDDLKLLPSSCTKASVYNSYVEACNAGGIQRIVSQSAFLQLWRECLPEVLPMKPSTDLCWTCQRNSMLLGRLANLSEEEKLAKINQAQQHIRHATTERAFYNDVVQKAKDAVKDKQPPVRLHEPGHGVHDCSVDMMSHYSFDFAQQLHFPSNPQQPGPIYFKTPRKCGVFGVVAEAIPQMVLFLLDEAVDTGKGANTVISMLDFFFENFSLKETECHLHADNCTGQNKNNAMLHYLLWRVMTKRHKKITLSFLVAGHTKFSPDWCFGLFKRTFRRAKVDCLNDIVEVARRSSKSGIIRPHLCGTEDGTPLVPVRNWNGYLDTWFRKLVGLKRYHHFEFLESGEVHVRLTCDSDLQVINLLKDTRVPCDSMIAPIIKPNGLSQQRAEYLFSEIREFVAEEHRDLVCPPPPTVHPQSASHAIASTSTAVTPAPSKKKVGRPKKSPRGLAARKVSKQ